MGQRLITLRVRPARVAVLINAESTWEDFVLAVRFLSQIWGGRFNPILPVSVKEPDRLTEFRLGKHRPDFVFGLNLDDSVWGPAVHRACQPRKYVRLEESVAQDIRKADRLKLIHSDSAIIASFEHQAKLSAIVHPVKTVCVDPTSEMTAYSAALFGVHPASLIEHYRDEEVVIENADSIKLIDTHREFVEGWERSWIDAGCFGLSSHHMLSPPMEPTVVVVENVIQDLCLFWNLRMASDADTPAWIIPIPKSSFSDGMCDSLMSWLLAFTNYGNKPNYCLMTSASVAKNTIDEMADKLQTKLSGSSIQYVDYEPPKNSLPLVVAFEHTVTWPAELQRRRLTIVPPSPKTFTTSSSESWFVDILKDNKTGRAVLDVQLPEVPIIPEILNSPCPPSFEHSFIPRFGDGYDSVNFHCTYSKDVIHFQIPTGAEVLEEILREHGYNPTPDEKRSSYLPVIRRFGGLHMAAKAMSGQAGQVLEILRSGRLRSAEEQAKVDDIHHQFELIAQGHSLTPKQIKGHGHLGSGKLGDSHYLDLIEQMLRSESDRVKRIGMARYREFAQREVPEAMTPQSLLEHWAERSVLVRKWVLGPCPHCDRKSFVSIINLRRIPRCVHCGKHQQLREQVGVAYALEPSVRHALSEGLGPVVLTGRFLRNMTNKGFFWLPGVKYEKNGIRGDIDLLACCDGELVFAECKKLTNTPHDSVSWNSTVEQFLALASVAMECDGDLAVLATLADDVPVDVQQQIKSKLSGKIPYLLLNKADLEKGNRPARQDKGWITLGLDDLLARPFPETPVEKSQGLRSIDFGSAIFKKVSKSLPEAD